MYDNEAVTNIIYSTDVRTTDCWIADAGPQNILEPPSNGGYLCSGPILTVNIFTTYDSARGITSMIQKRLDKLREHDIRQCN